MSTEATWDLYANYSPRSLCVFPVPTSNASGSSTASRSAAAAAAATTQNTVALVYGTDRGSLHYRCYRPTGGSSRTGAYRSNPQGQAAQQQQQQQQQPPGSSTSPTKSNAANQGRIVAPLGMTGGGGGAGSSKSGGMGMGMGGSSARGGGGGASGTAALPRTLYPVDLAGSTLPGPVVSCTWINGHGIHHSSQYNGSSGGAGGAGSTGVNVTSSSSLPPLFLVLVDDPRGSSAAQPGAYSAYWVTLQHGTFQVLNNAAAAAAAASSGSGSGNSSNKSSKSTAAATTNAFALPRLSAVVAAHGRVYATAGRRVFTLRVPTANLWPSAAPGASSSTTETASNQRTTASSSNAAKQNNKNNKAPPRLHFGPRVWPGPVRCGPDALAVVAGGRVVVGCVGHAFYAVAGEEIHRDEDDDDDDDDAGALDDPLMMGGDAADLGVGSSGGVATPGASGSGAGGVGVSGTGEGGAAASSADTTNKESVKLVHWTQSSQVHPVVALDLGDVSLETDWSCLFLANGRECAVVDVYYGPSSHQPRLSKSHKPRNGIVTTASPILAAAASWPLVAILMSDGLISVRSPSCLAVSLRTVEIGTRPNDFFTLRPVVTMAMTQHGPTRNTSIGGSGVRSSLSLWDASDSATSATATAAAETSSPTSTWILPQLVGISYAGEAKVLQCRPDTAQDLADRLMRHAIDAFGGNGFPRTELAQAVQASFTATSYVGPEASPQARILLKEYLEAVLGLCDWESGASSGWPTTTTLDGQGTAGAMGIMGASTASATAPAGPSSSSLRAAHSTLAAADGEGGGFHGKWSFVANNNNSGNDSDASRQAHLFASVLTASQPAALLTHTALLCLVASQLSPPAAALASRAAKACAAEMGVVLSSQLDDSAVAVGQLVTDQLLRESSQAFSLGITPKAPTIQRMHRPSQVSTDYIEASIWLLRSCGQHERAMEVAAERLQQNPSPEISGGSATASAAAGRGGQWSRIKYESYTATHLSELWCSGNGTSAAAGAEDAARELVLRSTAAHALLESNPRLGLSVFTALHPQNATQWRSLLPRDDPFRSTDYVFRVVSLLKSIRPRVPYDKNNSNTAASAASKQSEHTSLPLESGRALAVTFLESATGLSTGRPIDSGYDSVMGPGGVGVAGIGTFDPTATIHPEESHEEVVANFHDELALLLLEGVLSERSDEVAPGSEEDTKLGRIYRSKLRYLLRWPLAKIRPERFMESLPPSFLPEKALVLGRMGRHEDALRILYRDLKSLDMALEYCDDRYERQQAMMEKQQRVRQQQQQQQAVNASPGLFHAQDRDLSAMNVSHDNSDDGDVVDEDNAYLPLVRVALESEDTAKGCAAAIQVLSLRRTSINRAAALRLLPPDIPVSAVARPFLIPALVDSESQVRRLTVVSALLRARYLRLKEQLTSAQLKAQANLQVVPQLRSLNLGDNPLHSTKPFRARTSGGGGAASSSSGNNNTTSSSNNMPEVWIVKHFFPRHLVIQARVTNQAGLSDKAGRTLTDVAFVVAESSEEAIQPLLQVPITVLPSSMTGSTWCVLSAAPTRMEGSTAQLTCELRYTVGQGDVMGALGGAGQAAAAVPAAVMGKTYVEELQDLEVHASHF